MKGGSQKITVISHDFPGLQPFRVREGLFEIAKEVGEQFLREEKEEYAQFSKK
jgi:hypothetical protein